MLITLVSLYVLVTVVFFGSLAFVARQPMPAMEPADMVDNGHDHGVATTLPERAQARELSNAAA